MVVAAPTNELATPMRTPSQRLVDRNVISEARYSVNRSTNSPIYASCIPYARMVSAPWMISLYSERTGANTVDSRRLSSRCACINSKVKAV
ncbi:hypothetical protein FBU59_001669 [Linderina macrospora]|uniref:Uncharacterized protein n=1 Tax=Linderina macrospora TaxID=4868 RepID=A0ACC1JDN5_9FUNG|nr:hypothetical protein FBU59_001669 [Linderina macrospora]